MQLRDDGGSFGGKNIERWWILHNWLVFYINCMLWVWGGYFGARSFRWLEDVGSLIAGFIEVGIVIQTLFKLTFKYSGTA